jgi:WD40 repeat protein/energy-coupling factor transporter ATP-binding protein EcfA2
MVWRGVVARVFVSYASVDRECATRLHGWLVAEGHEVFFDQDPRDGIVVGEEWQRRLHERLRWADAVVCVVSSRAVTSLWCIAEISIALSQGSRVLPVRAEPGVLHPLLSSAQYADLIGDADATRAALRAALRRVDAAGGFGWPDDRSPFRGLRPLEVEDHRVFFGRKDEVQRLAALMRSPAQRAEGAVLLVVGPSGCGKSSLVRAGLLHVMAEEPGWWVLPAILPGADPVAALVRELAAAAQQLGLDSTMADIRHQLFDEDGLSGLVDELLLAARARRLLIVVDQFEELFTQARSAARARFAWLLRSVLGDSVQVVATLRPEFLIQLQGDSDLELPTQLYQLRPLRQEALAAVIQSPARLAGISVDEELVTRLVSDTESGEALPLLAFTLAELAEGVGRGGHLSPQRYEQIGKVQGALTRQADAALDTASAVSGRSHQEVIAGLLRLVAVDEQGRPTRRRVVRDGLPETVLRELDAFVQRGLIVTDTDQDGVIVGVAHEAVLTAWTPLAQAIKDNTVALRACQTVEQAATQWNKEGRLSVRLWERGQLATARADTCARIRNGDLVTDRGELSSTARAFLHASIRRDRFRQSRAVLVLSVLLLAALVGAGVAVIQQRDSVHQRDVAVSQHVAEQALELRATNPTLAAQLALAAYRLIPTTEARGSVLSVSASPYSTQLTGHTSTVFSVAFSPDGHTLATASDDHTAQLWDMRDPHHPALLSTLTGHANGVNAVAFSPDGRTLTSASDDHTARLWDVRDPHHPALLSTLTGHTGTVRSVAFSPDGRTLTSASDDHTARLWDVRDLHHPVPLSTLTGHIGTVFSVAFSPDGRTLASASEDQTIRVWDIGDPHHPALLSTLTGHIDTVHSVTFSPDGQTLASASDDQTARLWDIGDPHQPTALGILTGHTSGLYSVAFSPDGHTLATASNDRTARLWDLPGPIVTGHTNAVRSVAFSPDGHTLATASNDHTARLWNVHNPHQLTPLSTLTGHTGTLHSVAFSPDGHTLATASDDHTTRLWNVRAPHHPTTPGILTGHTNIVRAVAFSPDGHTLATASNDQTARLWDIRDLHHPTTLGILTGHTNDVAAVAFSPDGHTLATASNDQTARLWDIHDPHHPTTLGILTGHTNGLNAVAFSPDGQTLATASDDHTARLWDIRDPHHPTTLGILTGHTNTVNAVVFSPDGHTLATASDDHTARLWDVRDPHHPMPLGILTGHTNIVISVAFSPDGHTLTTSSEDQTTRLWETNMDNVVARICRITPSITKIQWNQYLPGITYRPPCP